MKLFGKKKVMETPETMELNRLFRIAITFNQNTGTWDELPTDISAEINDEVIAARKLVFEYIRQLKENRVYADRAVYSFAGERFPWINKDNIKMCIQLGQYL